MTEKTTTDNLKINNFVNDKETCNVCNKKRKVFTDTTKVGFVCRKCFDTITYWQKVHEYDCKEPDQK